MMKDFMNVVRHRTYKAHGRPIICTEYLAREYGTTFQQTLPILKKRGIGAINWGFVQGKTQTIWNWKTIADIELKRASSIFVQPNESYPEPNIWFHDIFRVNRTAYDQTEVDFLRDITADNKEFK
jgi:hypothetical protein